MTEVNANAKVRTIQRTCIDFSAHWSCCQSPPSDLSECKKGYGCSSMTPRIRIVDYNHGHEKSYGKKEKKESLSNNVKIH